ncbi:NfeD family protein [Marinilactibacillus sp. XAAS-LB27]|uniref:NfeD family protein n=1 Tax=Marinilactibacillus sp. XAAS-LB27 TaxID=3114538 RepID=UPI002E1758F4|nr:NfeD family protein [Marinilactibacillus sp. XAAS-LB27]
MEGLLLAIGFIGVAIAILTPLSKTGFSITMLSFIAYFSIIGVDTWLPLVLFTAGLLLIIFEIFVPEFGVAGILGALFLISGLYLTLGDIVMTIRDLSMAIVITSGVVFYLVRTGYSLTNVNKLILHTNLKGNQKTTTKKSTVQVEPGLEGVTQTPLRPSGKVSFGTTDGILVDVLSDEGYISKDVTVVIEKVLGTKVIVRKK